MNTIISIVLRTQKRYMYGYMPATSMGLLCDVQGLTLLTATITVGFWCPPNLPQHPRKMLQPVVELPLTYGCEALSFHEPSWHVPFLGDCTQVWFYNIFLIKFTIEYIFHLRSHNLCNLCKSHTHRIHKNGGCTENLGLSTRARHFKTDKIFVHGFLPSKEPGISFSQREDIVSLLITLYPHYHQQTPCCLVSSYALTPCCR